MKEYTTFNGKKYHKSPIHYDTKDEAKRRKKQLKLKGMNTIIDKRKEGYILWTNEGKQKGKVINVESFKKLRLNPASEKVIKILKSGKSGKKLLTYNTIQKRVQNEGYSYRDFYEAMDELKYHKIIESKKVYKELPGGRGLSRKFTWKYELK